MSLPGDALHSVHSSQQTHLQKEKLPDEGGDPNSKRSQASLKRCCDGISTAEKGRKLKRNLLNLLQFLAGNQKEPRNRRLIHGAITFGTDKAQSDLEARGQMESMHYPATSSWDRCIQLAPVVGESAEQILVWMHHRD